VGVKEENYKGGSMGRGCESVFWKEGVDSTGSVELHAFSDRRLLSFSDFTRRRGVVSLRTGSNGQFAPRAMQTLVRIRYHFPLGEILLKEESPYGESSR